MNIPRPEHPNPQFERKNWINLNGEWEFEIDFSSSGTDREFFKIIKLNSENAIKPVVVMLPRSCEPVVCFVGALYSANPYR